MEMGKNMRNYFKKDFTFKFFKNIFWVKSEKFVQAVELP